MNILLTGATGLLGSHLLQQGLAKGHSFKVISRKVPKRSLLAQIQESDETHVELLETDLTNPDLWPENLLEGVDAVINCAALASPFEKDIPLMRALNLEAPKELYQMAAKAGIKHWVQISSVSTMCDGQSSETVDESFQGQFRQTVYAETKYECDQWLDAHNDIPTLIMHPCYMLGAWDCRPSSGAILFALRMKKIQHFISNHKNFVDASDVAAGVWLGLEKEAKGHYLLGNVNTSIEDFVQKACEQLKVDFSTIAFHSEAQLDQLDIPEAPSSMAREFSLSCEINCDKAKKELGYDPKVGLDQMIQHALDFFQDKRMLRIR